MEQFDLSSVYDNTILPSVVCGYCGYIASRKEAYLKIDEEYIYTFTCPYCNQDSYSGQRRPRNAEMEDLHTYAKTMSPVVQRMGLMAAGNQSKLLEQFFYMLTHAQNFVHFTSRKISPFFIGALRMLAHQGVGVRGVIFGIDSKDKWTQGNILNVLTDHTANGYENNFAFTLYENGNLDTPYEKLIVIDGMLAIKGSMNLTMDGWENTANQRKMIEIETVPTKVIQLNNSRFNPVFHSGQLPYAGQKNPDA